MASPKNAPTLINLNVGGISYATTTNTLLREKDSVFSNYFSNDKTQDTKVQQCLIEVGENSYFIDRDGHLFRFILDYLRSGKALLPEPFTEMTRLREEAKFYHLGGLTKQLKTVEHNGITKTRESTNGSSSPLDSGGHITVGYRGTFAFGRDGQADVKFRKLNRILVCGKAALCRDVFGESLNESRDPDREGSERYTSRLYLKHQNIERAFDLLAEKGFHLVVSCASGANGIMLSNHGMPLVPGPASANQAMADMSNPRSNADWEEQRNWQPAARLLMLSRS